MPGASASPGAAPQDDPAAAQVGAAESGAADAGAQALIVQAAPAPEPAPGPAPNPAPAAAGTTVAGSSAVLAPDQAQQVMRCVLYASGIIGMLVVYGLLQERIMTTPFDGEMFTFSVFLVFLNRIAAVIFATGMACANKESLKNGAPLWKYLIVSLSNVYASACQYEALKYVSFAVQMLGKSFKMLPVMVWGLAISGKVYKAQDWAVAIAVTAGVTEFLMTGPTESADHHVAGNTSKGLVLLLCFLALDGLTSTMQEKLFKEHQTTKYNQMIYINSLSSCVSLMTLLLGGSLVPATKFFFTHPSFILDTTVLSASAVGGQWFIYSLVGEFGALVFAATMNVRQVVSIIVSYITYHHHITLPQIAGLSMVFGALFFKSVSALRQSPDERTRAKTPAPAAGERDKKASPTAPLYAGNQQGQENEGYGATAGSRV